MLAGVVDVHPDSALQYYGPLHDSAGILGGFGYAAAFALLARRIDRGGPEGRGRLVEAVAATGQRSMTCYLAQSVVWAVVFTPFLLDLSRTPTVASTAAIAAGTWLVTVAIADELGHRGRRGPFEDLVRRATYGSR